MQHEHVEANPEDARNRLNTIYGDDEYLGPRCFGPRIRTGPFPPKFALAKHIKTYNGDVKPHTWLQDYAMVVTIANENPCVACKFLPLMLEDTSQIWIDGLPKNSIHCWQDMKEAFMHNFEGTYKRP
jgi:hypothetical protein